MAQVNYIDAPFSIVRRGASHILLSCTIYALADILLDKNIEREILNHRRLSHPNILGFREVFTMDTHLCIVVRSTLIVLLHPRYHKLPASTDQRKIDCQGQLLVLLQLPLEGVQHRRLEGEMSVMSARWSTPAQAAWRTGARAGAWPRRRRGSRSRSCWTV